MSDVDRTIFEKEFGTRVSELNLPGKKRIAVLVNGGSFNPIHNGHLEMYVVARNELIRRKLFDEVLIIYCASPYKDVIEKIKQDHKEKTDPETKKKIPIKIYLEYPCKNYEESYTRHTFDSGNKDRIKICREAFASIDNIIDSMKSSDGKHLSKNMFVWYEESDNPYKNGIKNSAPGTGITFYGLSGSDYSKNLYFTNGMDGNSIMVSRDSKKPAPNGFNINPQKIYIAASSNIDTASSTIRPDIDQLRNFIETANGQQVNNFIAAKDGSEAAEEALKPRPEPNLAAAKAVAAAITAGTTPLKPVVTPFDAAVATIRLLKSVPNSILFRLLTYHDIPSNRGRHDKYKWGYMQFRRLLFAQKLTTTTTTTKVIQRQHTIVSDTTARELLSNLEHVSKLSDLPGHNKTSPPIIEFLQMSTAHALSLQKQPGNLASALNFANANNVGGGVLRGSTVQEETLCMMAPELYVSLKNAASATRNKETYSNWGDTNWDKKFYYSQKPVPVPFTTTDEFTFKPVEVANQYTGHIISAAAYDWKHNLKHDAAKSQFDITTIKTNFIKCIKNMAAVAAVEQNCNVLILGAWGCGAFAPRDADNLNLPSISYIKEVAGMFCEALYSPIGVGGSPLKYKDLFKKVIFPIPDCRTYDAFKSAFDEAENPKKIAAAAVAAAAAVPKVVAAAAAVPKVVAPKVAVAGNPTSGDKIAEKIANYKSPYPKTGSATIEDFLGAHEYGFKYGLTGCSTFEVAIAELKSSQKGTHWKQKHWMWYIIPVPNNVSSQTAMFFKVNNTTTNVNPVDFMRNTILRQHYVLMINQIWECVKILDAAKKDVMANIMTVMNSPDNEKLLLSANTFKPIIDANNFNEFDDDFKTIISALSYLYLNQSKKEVLSVDDLLAIIEAKPAATARPVAITVAAAAPLKAAAVAPLKAAAVAPLKAAAPVAITVAAAAPLKEDKYSLDSATGILNLTFKDPAKLSFTLKVGDCIKYTIVGKEKMCIITKFNTLDDKKYSDGTLIVTAIGAECYGEGKYPDIIQSKFFNTITIDAGCHDYTKKATPIDTIAAAAAAAAAAKSKTATLAVPSSPSSSPSSAASGSKPAAGPAATATLAPPAVPAVPAAATVITPPKPPAVPAAATPPKPPAVPAVKPTIPPKEPVKPEAPKPIPPAIRPTLAPDDLIEFDAADPWTFYRCLMRGYMMAVIDSPPANAALKTPPAPPPTSDTLANQRNRLTFDTKKSILDSDNVFYFDDFTITECDTIIGMVTRLSKWIKFKLEKDAPRQYFTSLADQTALLSSADFFVHQLELAFKDSKHIMSSSTTATTAPASPEPKNETEFLDKLTDYSYNNTGKSNVFAKYDAAKRSVINATRKTKDAISRVPGAVKSAASDTWLRTKTGTRKIWTRRVTVPIEDMKYAKAERAIANADTSKADAQRVKSEIERTREGRASPSVVQAGGAQQSFNIDIMAPLKTYKEEKLGKIIDMSDPSMRVENYFELMTKIITTKNAKGEEQVVPAIFGHPLLLYLPFARAFMCGINVYTNDGGTADEKYTLKYSVPSQYEWEKNQNMPIIHLLDKNKIDDTDFLNAAKYSSNFSLLYKNKKK